MKTHDSTNAGGLCHKRRNHLIHRFKEPMNPHVRESFTDVKAKVASLKQLPEKMVEEWGLAGIRRIAQQNTPNDETNTRSVRVKIVSAYLFQPFEQRLILIQRYKVAPSLRGLAHFAYMLVTVQTTDNVVVNFNDFVSSDTHLGC